MHSVSCEILDGKELLNEQSGFLSPLYIPYEGIMLVTSLLSIVTQKPGKIRQTVTQHK
jgi:hypothetical protein